MFFVQRGKKMYQKKIRELIKYCLAYKKTGRINKCARIIGKSLFECEATIEDVRVAKLLLNVLENGN